MGLSSGGESGGSDSTRSGKLLPLVWFDLLNIAVAPCTPLPSGAAMEGSNCDDDGGNGSNTRYELAVMYSVLYNG